MLGFEQKTPLAAGLRTDGRGSRRTAGDQVGAQGESRWQLGQSGCSEGGNRRWESTRCPTVFCHRVNVFVYWTLPAHP